MIDSIAEAIINIIFAILKIFALILYTPFKFVIELHPYIKYALLTALIGFSILILWYIWVTKKDIYRVLHI